MGGESFGLDEVASVFEAPHLFVHEDYPSVGVAQLSPSGRKFFSSGSRVIFVFWEFRRFGLSELNDLNDNDSVRLARTLGSLL